MNYFVDYCLTESWNEFIKKRVRNALEKGEYKFEEKNPPPKCTRDFVLSNDKFK